MSEMVERGARALYRLVTKTDLGPGEPIPPHLEDRARAAIEALREPTEAMLMAGIGEFGLDVPVKDDLRHAFHAMIDAALAKP